jgi:hypothetical protein
MAIYSPKFNFKHYEEKQWEIPDIAFDVEMNYKIKI